MGLACSVGPVHSLAFLVFLFSRPVSGAEKGCAISWLKSRLSVVTLLPWVCLGRESWDEQVEKKPSPDHGAAGSLCLPLTGDSLTPTTWVGGPLLLAQTRCLSLSW